jgi:hypothetical protein
MPCRQVLVLSNTKPVANGLHYKQFEQHEFYLFCLLCMLPFLYRQLPCNTLGWAIPGLSVAEVPLFDWLDVRKLGRACHQLFEMITLHNIQGYENDLLAG